jgi:hypothetical protein
MSHAPTIEPTAPPVPVPLNRRDVLKLAGTALTPAAVLSTAAASAQAAPSRSVIVAGAGIGGLCCAFELMERGHDVTVLEASGRAGGHVKTIHHFAGSHADNLPWGMDAATRSANRVARSIHEA